MNNKLFLVFNEKLYFFHFCNDNKNVLCKQVFSKNKLKFFCARLIRKFNKKVPVFLLGDWYKELKNIDLIVITDYAYYLGIKEDIKKKNPKCKIYMYLMNSVNTITMEIFKNINKEFSKEDIYSFDYLDSINYGYNFKITPYKKKELHFEHEEKYDLLFVGRDKGRVDFLEQLFCQCNINNMNTYIKVLNAKANPKISLNQFMTYDHYLDYVNNSSTLLEIVTEKQSGITLRTLEALFYNKKLITNNKNIVLYEFYDYFRENILIIDINNYSIIEILEFIRKDYTNFDQKKLNKLDFYQWLSNFN